MNDALDELLNAQQNAVPAMLGHNNPPDEPTALDLLKKRVSALVATANRWATERPVITDADMAGRCEDFLSQVRAEAKAVEDERKAQQKPHDEAVKAIRAAFSPLTAMLDAVRDVLAPRRTAWLVKEQARVAAEKKAADDAAYAAIEAVEKAKREAEEALTKPGADVIGAMVAAEAAAVAAALATKKADAAPVRAQVKGDFSQRARGLTTRWRWRVADINLVPDHLWQINETAIGVNVAQLTKGLPHGSVPRATIPGIEIYSEQT